ncbi:hypothetical protein EsH8_V_000939 [Colletotrichum jinshuiense]
MNITTPELSQYAMSSNFSSMADANSAISAYDLIAAQFAARIGSNENGYCTPSSLWSSPPSPTSSIDTSKAGDCTDESGHSSASVSDESSAKTSAKGRRANRYKDCSESVLSKRRAQNRANQRAYRKRKEQRLEELQLQIDEMSQKHEALSSAYRLMVNECSRLRASQQQQQQPTSGWNLNTGASLALDMSALNTYRVAAPPSTSSPVTESYFDYNPGSPEKMWSAYTS